MLIFKTEQIDLLLLCSMQIYRYLLIVCAMNFMVLLRLRINYKMVVNSDISGVK
jgi:hypothetical protein